MKIKLHISENQIDEVKSFFESRDIEVGDDGEYILLENLESANHLMAKDTENGDKVVVAVSDILYIESYGHQLEITTLNGKYISNAPLYQIEEQLDKRKFSRISKSVIIAKKQVKKIIPALSMKYTLIMKDSKELVVTRNFYTSFKKDFRI